MAICAIGKKLITNFTNKFPDSKYCPHWRPSDQFTKELEIEKNVINLSGKLSLSESSCLVTFAKCTVSADTGIIHVVDAHQNKGVLPRQPTAFGKHFLRR